MRSAFSSRRRRRLAAGLALVLVVAVVVGVVLSAGSGAPKPASSARSTSGATTVERRDLVETDTESGTLGYANPQTGYDRLSGTITWLPSVGQVIEFWQTLFEVDSEPVILMNGTRPAYRDLSASDTAGQDILQLNRNLVDLGFDPAGIVVDDEWQAATTAGVDSLQASLVETETGTLALGQIVFLPGDQLISTVDATVGSTSGSAGSQSSSANASTPAAAASPEFVGLTSTAAPRDSTTATSTSASPTTTSTTTPTTTTNLRKTKTSKPTSVRKPTSSSSSQTLEGLTALLKAEAAQLKAATAALKAAKSSTTSSAHSSSSKSSSSSSKSSSSSSSGSGGSASAMNTVLSRVVHAHARRGLRAPDLWPDWEIPKRVLIHPAWQTKVTQRLRRTETDVRVQIARDMIGRIRELTRTITQLYEQLTGLVKQAAPQLLAERGLGVLIAAKLIGEIAGIDRFTSDAQLARISGCAPIPVSSGRTDRHRLDPGRQPPTQPRLPHARPHQNHPRPPDRGLHRQTTQERQDQQRSDPQPQTPPRPRRLPPTPQPRARSHDHLLDIGGLREPRSRRRAGRSRRRGRTRCRDLQDRAAR